MLLIKQLHAVSTGEQELREWVNKTVKIHPFVDYIHIREREWGTEKITHAVNLLKERGVPLTKIMLNGFPILAEMLQVGGVHLPESKELPAIRSSSLKTGASVHDIEKALQKERNGAEYIFFGHIFTTKSKPDLSPKGLEALSQVTHAVQIPVVAIGGITPQRIKDCVKAGAEGVAVLTGIYEAKHPVAAAQNYRKSLREVNGDATYV